MYSHLFSKDYAGAEPGVVICKAADADRVVIDLDSTYLKMIADPDIQSSADGPGKSGVRDRFVRKAGRTSRTGRGRTCQLGKFRTRVGSADQRMGKGLPCPAVPVVFDLNAAEEVVQRVVVLCRHIHRPGRVRKYLVQSLALKVRGKVALDPEPSAEIVNTTRFEPIEVCPIAKEIVDRTSAVNACVDLPVRVADVKLSLFDVGRLAENDCGGKDREPKGREKSSHVLSLPDSNLKREMPHKFDTAKSAGADRLFKLSLQGVM